MYAESVGLLAGYRLGLVGSGVTREKYSSEVLSGPTEGKMVLGCGRSPFTRGFQRGVRGGLGMEM